MLEKITDQELEIYKKNRSDFIKNPNPDYHNDDTQYAIYKKSLDKSDTNTQAGKKVTELIKELSEMLTAQIEQANEPDEILEISKLLNQLITDLSDNLTEKNQINKPDVLDEVYIHYGAKKYDPNKWTDLKQHHLDKPAGGLRSSPVNAEYGWKQWNDNQRHIKYEDDDCFKFQLKSDAKILVIDNEDVIRSLPRIVMNADIDLEMIDFKQLAKEYDAIKYIRNDETRWDFYSWDCDSLLVMNKDKIVPLE